MCTKTNGTALDLTVETAAEIVNNYNWFKNFSFLEFIREAGKHISINYMLAKTLLSLV